MWKIVFLCYLAVPLLVISYLALSVVYLDFKDYLHGRVNTYFKARFLYLGE